MDNSVDLIIDIISIFFYNLSMKLEALVKSVNNGLCFLDGKNIVVDMEKKCSLGDMAKTPDQLFFMDMPWECVGMDEDSYNEDFLAQTRDALKTLDESTTVVAINPVTQKIPQTPSEKESFVASMKHSARRIKDCKNVVGYVIPDFVDQDFFMEELSAKHKHYVFFSRNPKDSSIVKV